MSKRYFRVTTQSAYGGEIVVGTVSQEFVDYWQNSDESLVEAMWNYDDAVEEGAPPLGTEPDASQEWHDQDDIEHYNNCSEESCLWVCEVDADGEEIGEDTRFDEFGENVYNREGGMVYESIPTDYGQDDKWIPVVTMYSVEKGGFWDATVETDGEDFDPEKIHFGVIENNMDCLIESVYYGKEELELGFDWCDTRGKDSIAEVGYINETYQRLDSREAWADGSDNVKESFEEMEEYA